MQRRSWLYRTLAPQFWVGVILLVAAIVGAFLNSYGTALTLEELKKDPKKPLLLLFWVGSLVRNNFQWSLIAGVGVILLAVWSAINKVTTLSRSADEWRELADRFKALQMTAAFWEQVNGRVLRWDLYAGSQGSRVATEVNTLCIEAETMLRESGVKVWRGYEIPDGRPGWLWLSCLHAHGEGIVPLPWGEGAGAPFPRSANLPYEPTGVIWDVCESSVELCNLINTHFRHPASMTGFAFSSPPVTSSEPEPASRPKVTPRD